MSIQYMCSSINIVALICAGVNSLKLCVVYWIHPTERLELSTFSLHKYNHWRLASFRISSVYPLGGAVVLDVTRVVYSVFPLPLLWGQGVFVTAVIGSPTIVRLHDRSQSLKRMRVLNCKILMVFKQKLRYMYLIFSTCIIKAYCRGGAVG